MAKDSDQVIEPTDGEEPLVETSEDGGLTTDGRGGYLEGQGGGGTTDETGEGFGTSS